MFVFVRTCKTRFDTNYQVHGCCNIAVQSCYYNHSLTTCSIMYEHGCWFIMMVPTTLFKSVRTSSHDERTDLNNHQLNHVQACQQHRYSSWPAQPCSSLWTGKNKCVHTIYLNNKHKSVQSTYLPKNSQTLYLMSFLKHLSHPRKTVFATGVCSILISTNA